MERRRPQDGTPPSVFQAVCVFYAHENCASQINEVPLLLENILLQMKEFVTITKKSNRYLLT